jgi:hypothetical protein
MPRPTATPFATHGGEKMIYDVRMGPQALLHEGTLYVAYHGNPDGPESNPYLITRDVASGAWSDTQQLGSTARNDHHYCPVLWFDADDRIHVLYGCHGRDGGTHIVSTRPLSTDTWEPGPEIAPSISYPHILPMAGGRHVLYHRVQGHMGYWAYRVSPDGGWTWGDELKITDFDRDPITQWDCWAGSYHSVIADPNRRALHIGFVFLDEQRRLNPRYNRRFRSKRTINRYHLYYLRLDLDTGTLTTYEGDEVEPPLNRAAAEAAKIWDTGWRLTMQPSIALDDRGEPCFLLPASGETPWNCTFWFVHRRGDEWRQVAVASTTGTWSGCLLDRDQGGVLLAHVISGGPYGETLPYGGGALLTYGARDDGASWVPMQGLESERQLLCNNPRHVEDAAGNVVPGYLLFFGWSGPGGIDLGSSSGYQGRAFLWHRGEWK